MLASNLKFRLKTMYSIVNWLGFSQNQNNGKDVINGIDSIFYYHYGSHSAFKRYPYYAWGDGCDQFICLHMVF